MMKKISLTFFFVIIALFCFAQDIIVTTDARRIEAKVLEVSESEVKYKETDNLEGPTFIISTNNISSIVYANGKVALYQGTPTATNDPSDSNSAPFFVTRMGEKYTYKGVVMRGDVYAYFLSDNCPNAYLVYHNGYIVAYTGLMFLSVAVGLELGTLIGGAIAGGYNSSSLPFMYCALGCSVASIPLLIVGYNKMHKSVDVFNQECSRRTSRMYGYWSVNASKYGVGLAFNF